MKNAYLIVIIAVVLVAASAVLTAPSVMAGGFGEPRVIDPGSVAYGRTYSEWSTAWEQWSTQSQWPSTLSLTTATVAWVKSGPVWFLGGKFCANNASSRSFTGVVRSCKVPSGKALYFPVFNGEDSALEESVVEHPGD